MNKRLLIINIIIIICICSVKIQGQNTDFQPGKIWNDTKGKPINAHGGGILYHNGTYYWFGEIKKGNTWRVPYIISWECYRTNAGGISCYSSKNLLDWKYEGVALKPNLLDSSSDLHISKVIERPKVIYNEKTKKFVMWMHIDSEDYSYACAGVATSNKPTGPYKYFYSMQPNNHMSRDMTLFKDDDGKAYHIYSSEENSTLHIGLLSDDYLTPSGKFIRIMENNYREAPAMFKHNSKYYLITSGCTGWDSNQANYAVSDSVMGQWEVVGNPCLGEGADKTFQSQSTYILPVKGKDGAFIFMADRWNKTNLEDSRYIWLPLKFNGDKPVIEWVDSWNLNYFNK